MEARTVKRQPQWEVIAEEREDGSWGWRWRSNGEVISGLKGSFPTAQEAERAGWDALRRYPESVKKPRR